MQDRVSACDQDVATGENTRHQKYRRQDDQRAHAEPAHERDADAEPRQPETGFVTAPAPGREKEQQPRQRDEPGPALKRDGRRRGLLIGRVFQETGLELFDAHALNLPAVTNVVKRRTRPRGAQVVHLGFDQSKAFPLRAQEFPAWISPARCSKNLLQTLETSYSK